MDKNNLSNLLNVLHFSECPNVVSKKREVLSTNSGFLLLIYLSPHEHLVVSIESFYKKYKNKKTFTVDNSILKISEKPIDDVLFGATPFFLTLGSEVSIEKVSDNFIVDILESEKFSIQDWGEDLEKIEISYLKSWSSWYLRLNGRVQVKSVNGDLEPTRDQMISTILEVESNLIKNKETSNHFRKKDLANNIENCRFYLENYLKTKDLKYLIEGYVRE